MANWHPAMCCDERDADADAEGCYEKEPIELGHSFWGHWSWSFHVDADKIAVNAYYNEIDRYCCDWALA
ncbi:MAG: hypothetical protein FWD08_00295 [Alphaproteobacteria bacterium]|nr:hypothetical protein [Alphaproteobacteria bacterium]